MIPYASISRSLFHFIFIFYPSFSFFVFVFVFVHLFLLRSEGSLKEQLERLPVICRFQYTAVAEFVLNIVDPVLASYQSVAQFPLSNGAVSIVRFFSFCTDLLASLCLEHVSYVVLDMVSKGSIYYRTFNIAIDLSLIHI